MFWRSHSLGPAGSSFSRSYKPAPCHLKANSSPTLKLVPHQRQIHLQLFIQCLHMVVSQKAFVKLTCSEPCKFYVQKSFCPSHSYKNFNFEGCSSLVQSYLLRRDFFLFFDINVACVCSCPFPLLIKSLSSLQGPPQIPYLSGSTLPDKSPHPPANMIALSENSCSPIIPLNN